MHCNVFEIGIVILFQVCYVHATATDPNRRQSERIHLCRDRFGLVEPLPFGLHSCTMCYLYLFASNKELMPDRQTNYLGLVSGPNATIYPPYVTRFLSDISNRTAKDGVCKTLTVDDCARWVQCCENAKKCCKRQRTLVLPLPSGDEKVYGGVCQSTWDGYACWDHTPAGRTVSQACPAYLKHVSTGAVAHKICSQNATWWSDPKTKLEWTNYTACVLIDRFKAAAIAGIVLNALSLAFLIPALFIFLYYRQLRRQLRVQLHFQLFVSLTLASLFLLLWEILVRLNSLTVEDKQQTFRNMHQVVCKVLHFFLRYSRSCTFFWMLCEGLYLHWLMVHAFEPPRNLRPHYVIGWGSALVIQAVYTVIRVNLLNDECWIADFGAFEWIIYVPNMLCLLCNLVFLCNILRILLRQLQAHPNEPHHYRRALKATFILVPLFGVELFCTVYRPHSSEPGYHAYEVFASVIISSQGILIAMLFCYTNGEVTCLLSKSWKRFRYARYLGEARRSITTSTHLTDTIHSFISRHRFSLVPHDEAVSTTHDNVHMNALHNNHETANGGIAMPVNSQTTSATVF